MVFDGRNAHRSGTRRGQYLKNNPEIADNLEAEIRRNFDKLMTGQSRVAAKAAGRAVDVSADDFKDED